MYSVKRLSEKNGDGSQEGSSDSDFNLCQILRVTKLKYVVPGLIEFIIGTLFHYIITAALFSFPFSCSIVDFFKELPQFVVKAAPILSDIHGADWENKLEVLINCF